MPTINLTLTQSTETLNFLHRNSQRTVQKFNEAEKRIRTTNSESNSPVCYNCFVVITVLQIALMLCSLPLAVWRSDYFETALQKASYKTNMQNQMGTVCYKTYGYCFIDE